MAVEIVTKEDLQSFKSELLAEFAKLLRVKTEPQKKWLQSPEVQKLLSISQGTLQHLRVTRKIPFTKIGGKIFYDIEDITSMIETHKVKNSWRGK